MKPEAISLSANIKSTTLHTSGCSLNVSGLFFFLSALGYLWELAVWHSRPRSRQRRSFLLCCNAWWWRSEPEDWRGSLIQREERKQNVWDRHCFLSKWVKRATSRDGKALKIHKTEGKEQYYNSSTTRWLHLDLVTLGWVQFNDKGKGFVILSSISAQTDIVSSSAIRLDGHQLTAHL